MESKLQTWLETAKKNAGWLIVLGIVEIVAGILAIAGPFVAGLAVTVMVGIAFLMGGGARLVGAFMADSFGGRRAHVPVGPPGRRDGVLLRDPAGRRAHDAHPRGGDGPVHGRHHAGHRRPSR